MRGALDRDRGKGPAKLGAKAASPTKRVYFDDSLTAAEKEDLGTACRHRLIVSKHFDKKITFVVTKKKDWKRFTEPRLQCSSPDDVQSPLGGGVDGLSGSPAPGPAMMPGGGPRQLTSGSSRSKLMVAKAADIHGFSASESGSVLAQAQKFNITIHPLAYFRGKYCINAKDLAGKKKMNARAHSEKELEHLGDYFIKVEDGSGLYAPIIGMYPLDTHGRPTYPRINKNAPPGQCLFAPPSLHTTTKPTKERRKQKRFIRKRELAGHCGICGVAYADGIEAHAATPNHRKKSRDPSTFARVTDRAIRCNLTVKAFKASDWFKALPDRTDTDSDEESGGGAGAVEPASAIPPQPTLATTTVQRAGKEKARKWTIIDTSSTDLVTRAAPITSAQASARPSAVSSPDDTGEAAVWSMDRESKLIQSGVSGLPSDGESETNFRFATSLPPSLAAPAHESTRRTSPRTATASVLRKGRESSGTTTPPVVAVPDSFKENTPLYCEFPPPLLDVAQDCPPDSPVLRRGNRDRAASAPSALDEVLPTELSSPARVTRSRGSAGLAVRPSDDLSKEISPRALRTARSAREHVSTFESNEAVALQSTTTPPKRAHDPAPTRSPKRVSRRIAGTPLSHSTGTANPSASDDVPRGKSAPRVSTTSFSANVQALLDVNASDDEVEIIHWDESSDAPLEREGQAAREDQPPAAPLSPAIRQAKKLRKHAPKRTGVPSTDESPKRLAGGARGIRIPSFPQQSQQATVTVAHRQQHPALPTSASRALRGDGPGVRPTARVSSPPATVARRQQPPSASASRGLRGDGPAVTPTQTAVSTRGKRQHSNKKRKSMATDSEVGTVMSTPAPTMKRSLVASSGEKRAAKRPRTPRTEDTPDCGAMSAPWRPETSRSPLSRSSRSSSSPSQKPAHERGTVLDIDSVPKKTVRRGNRKSPTLMDSGKRKHPREIKGPKARVSLSAAARSPHPVDPFEFSG